MKFLILVALLHLLCDTDSYKILVCYPLYVKSMNILGEAVVQHLLNDGHEVTFITTHPMVALSNKNFRQIDISSNNVFKNEKFNIGYIIENGIQETAIRDVLEFVTENAKMFFQNENVTNFLEKRNEHFDAVIVDLLQTEVYAGLAVLYNCPMIWVYSMGAHWQVLRLIGESANPAYDTDFRGSNIPPFTFMQRTEELWARIKWTLYKSFIITPIERNIYEQTFKPLLNKMGRELPDYEDVVYNSSFIFGNENKAIPFRPSTPQNFKYIGGFHVEDPAKPLSKDLQYLMDNATYGVIYFSMGSFWKSKNLPIKLTRGLIDMFGELKQTVIWKYEHDLKDLPKNIHIVQWAPQQSILAHPNCKFFITHGGLLSTTETIHFGVPIIGIPVLYDQFININKASVNGYAIKVDLNYDLPLNLKAAINDMLTNDRYRKKAMEYSSIYHDRPIKPKKELVYWVNHVIRTGGAPHLRSPAISVPLYQKLYLDLVALIISLLFIAVSSFLYVTKKL